MINSSFYFQTSIVKQLELGWNLDDCLASWVEMHFVQKYLCGKIPIPGFHWRSHNIPLTINSIILKYRFTKFRAHVLPSLSQMGSGVSSGSSGNVAGGGGTGHLTRETDSSGRRRLIYAYGGRRYDVSAFLERRARERASRSAPAAPQPAAAVAKPDQLKVRFRKKSIISTSHLWTR